MAGRGRPRGRGGATAETGAGPGRRSTRQQQQQHQQTQQSADVIDPNLSSNFDGSMPPPASRAAKTVRGSLGAEEGPDGHLEVSRRYTRRDGPARGASMAPSINSIPNTNSEFYSSQPEQISKPSVSLFCCTAWLTTPSQMPLPMPSFTPFRCVGKRPVPWLVRQVVRRPRGPTAWAR